MEKEQFNVRLPEDIISQLRSIAEAEERTIGVTTARLIREAINARKETEQAEEETIG